MIARSLTFILGFILVLLCPASASAATRSVVVNIESTDQEGHPYGEITACVSAGTECVYVYIDSSGRAAAKLEMDALESRVSVCYSGVSPTLVYPDEKISVARRNYAMLSRRPTTATSEFHIVYVDGDATEATVRMTQQPAASVSLTCVQADGSSLLCEVGVLGGLADPVRSDPSGRVQLGGVPKGQPTELTIGRNSVITFLPITATGDIDLGRVEVPDLPRPEVPIRIVDTDTAGETVSMRTQRGMVVFVSEDGSRLHFFMKWEGKGFVGSRLDDGRYGLPAGHYFVVPGGTYRNSLLTDVLRAIRAGKAGQLNGLKRVSLEDRNEPAEIEFSHTVLMKETRRFLDRVAIPAVDQ